MSDINILVDKIIKDAEVKSNEMLSIAAEEKRKIISQKEASAKSERESIIRKANSEAAARKDRIISSASLKIRNMKLEAKQKLISRVLTEAAMQLKELPKEKYLIFVKDSIMALQLNGDETIIVSQKDSEIINIDFISELNNLLISQGKVGKLKVNSSLKSLSGGFIVERHGIEINYTFEALLEYFRDELEQDIASILFN